MSNTRITRNAPEDEIDGLMASWNSHDRHAIAKRLAEIARSGREGESLATALRGVRAHLVEIEWRDLPDVRLAIDIIDNALAQADVEPGVPGHHDAAGTMSRYGPPSSGEQGGQQ